MGKNPSVLDKYDVLLRLLAADSHKMFYPTHHVPVSSPEHFYQFKVPSRNILADPLSNRSEGAYEAGWVDPTNQKLLQPFLRMSQARRLSCFSVSSRQSWLQLVDEYKLSNEPWIGG